MVCVRIPCNSTITLLIISTLVQLFHFNSLHNLLEHFVRLRTLLNQIRYCDLSIMFQFNDYGNQQAPQVATKEFLL